MMTMMMMMMMMCAAEQPHNHLQVQRRHFPAQESLRAVPAHRERLLPVSARAAGKHVLPVVLFRQLINRAGAFLFLDAAAEVVDVKHPICFSRSNGKSKYCSRLCKYSYIYQREV